MAEKVYIVNVEWDPEGGVWVADSDDVPGLVTGAETIPALIDKLRSLIPELLEANGALPSDDGTDVPVEIIAKAHERFRLRA